MHLIVHQVPSVARALAEGPAHAVFASALHCPDIPSIRDIVSAHPGLTQRIAAAFDQGLTVCTLGSAAWFAAASGRCEGRRVALPWYFMGGFGLDFAGIELAEGQPFVDVAAGGDDVCALTATGILPCYGKPSPARGSYPFNEPMMAVAVMLDARCGLTTGGDLR